MPADTTSQQYETKASKVIGRGPLSAPPSLGIPQQSQPPVNSHHQFAMPSRFCWRLDNVRHVVERGTTISLHSGAAEGDFVQSSQAPPEYGAMVRNRKN